MTLEPSTVSVSVPVRLLPCWTMKLIGRADLAAVKAALAEGRPMSIRIYVSPPIQPLSPSAQTMSPKPLQYAIASRATTLFIVRNGSRGMQRAGTLWSSSKRRKAVSPMVR